MALEGIIFDWDGVVINSARLHEESWELLANELGLTLPDNHFKAGFGKRNEIIIPDILKWTEDREKISHWGKRKEILYRNLGRSKGIPILDGVRDLLQSLKHFGFPCAIGTSTEKKNLELAFEQLHLASFFSGMICSEDVKQGKPNPEVFIKAAQIISQEPENCVVLEDSTHGIEAAKRGGMKALGLATTRSSEELLDCGADLVVESPKSINISLLKSLFMN